MNKLKLKRLNHYLLLIVSLLLIISGYGITQYQAVSKLTFGILSKPLAFKTHSLLGVAFIFLLAAHVCFVCCRRKKEK